MRLLKEQNWNFSLQLPVLQLKFALHRYFTFPADFDQRRGPGRRELIRSGFFYNAQQYPQCHFCGLVLEEEDFQNWAAGDLDLLHQQCNPQCPLMSDEADDHPLSVRKIFAFEAWRLYTFFEQDWPSKSVCPFELSKDGFYFTGEEDICRCYFCKLEVKWWEETDTAHGEHLRWNKDCPFIRGLVTANVKIGQENLPIVQLISPEERRENLLKTSACNIKRNQASGMPPIRPTETNLGVVPVARLCYPDHRQFESRRKTFDENKWPLQKCDLIDGLCSAGFFYTGKSDVCTCFCCGVSLSSWELDADPWNEHAKHQENCQHLRLFANEEKEDETRDTIDMRCRSCRKEEATCVCLPCGHICFCEGCVGLQPECPVCQRVYHFHLKIFIA